MNFLKNNSLFVIILALTLAVGTIQVAAEISVTLTAFRNGWTRGVDQVEKAVDHVAGIRDAAKEVGDAAKEVPEAIRAFRLFRDELGAFKAEIEAMMTMTPPEEITEELEEITEEPEEIPEESEEIKTPQPITTANCTGSWCPAPTRQYQYGPFGRIITWR